MWVSTTRSLAEPSSRVQSTSQPRPVGLLHRIHRRKPQFHFDHSNIERLRGPRQWFQPLQHRGDQRVCDSGVECGPDSYHVTPFRVRLRTAVLVRCITSRFRTTPTRILPVRHEHFDVVDCATKVNTFRGSFPVTSLAGGASVCYKATMTVPIAENGRSDTVTLTADTELTGGDRVDENRSSSMPQPPG